MNMLNNCQYNIVKLVHELSRIVWFIEKHALKDAREASDQKMVDVLQKIAQETRMHIAILRNNLCK